MADRRLAPCSLADQDVGLASPTYVRACRPHLLHHPLPEQRKAGRIGKASQKVIEALAPGKGVKVMVGPDQNVRGVKVSLNHAAKRLGKTVKLWDVDGVVYAELADD